MRNSWVSQTVQGELLMGETDTLHARWTGSIRNLFGSRVLLNQQNFGKHLKTMMSLRLLQVAPEISKWGMDVETLAPKGKKK